MSGNSEIARAEELVAQQEKLRDHVRGKLDEAATKRDAATKARDAAIEQHDKILREAIEGDVEARMAEPDCASERRITEMAVAANASAYAEAHAAFQTAEAAVDKAKRDLEVLELRQGHPELVSPFFQDRVREAVRGIYAVADVVRMVREQHRADVKVAERIRALGGEQSVPDMTPAAGALALALAELGGAPPGGANLNPLRWLFEESSAKPDVDHLRAVLQLAEVVELYSRTGKLPGADAQRSLLVMWGKSNVNAPNRAAAEADFESKSSAAASRRVAESERQRGADAARRARDARLRSGRPIKENGEPLGPPPEPPAPHWVDGEYRVDGDQVKPPTVG